MAVILEIDAKSDALAHLLYAKVLTAEQLFKLGLTTDEIANVVDSLVALAQHPLPVIREFFVAGLQQNTQVRVLVPMYIPAEKKPDRPPPSAAAAPPPTPPPPPPPPAPTAEVPFGYKSPLPAGVLAIDWACSIDQSPVETFEKLTADQRLVHWPHLTDKTQRRITAALKPLKESSQAKLEPAAPVPPAPPAAHDPTTPPPPASSPLKDPVAMATEYMKSFATPDMQTKWVMIAHASLDAAEQERFKREAGFDPTKVLNEHDPDTVQRYAVLVAAELLRKGLPLTRPAPPAKKLKLTKTEEPAK